MFVHRYYNHLVARADIELPLALRHQISIDLPRTFPDTKVSVGAIQRSCSETCMSTNVAINAFDVDSLAFRPHCLPRKVAPRCAMCCMHTPSETLCSDTARA